MIHSPDRKPLTEVTDEELKDMHRKAARTVAFSLADIEGELRYREQRGIADSMRKIVTIQVGIAGLAVVVAVVVAATNFIK